MKMFKMIQTWVSPRPQPKRNTFLVKQDENSVDITLTPEMFNSLMRAAIVGQAELRRSGTGLTKGEVSRLWYLHREAGIGGSPATDSNPAAEDERNHSMKYIDDTTYTNKDVEVLLKQFLKTYDRWERRQSRNLSYGPDWALADAMYATYKKPSSMGTNKKTKEHKF